MRSFLFDSFFLSFLLFKSYLAKSSLFCFSDMRSLTLKVPEMKIAEFANSVDLDEVAHDEPPHLDLHCLPSNI